MKALTAMIFENYGFGQYLMGAKETGFKNLEQSVEIAKKAYETDSTSKELFQNILQTSYYIMASLKLMDQDSTKACFYYSMAKQWGYTKTDSNLEKICK